MPGHETIAAYLETVGQQIRWRRARPVLLAELRQHLEDQRDAFAAEGREDAEHLAVEEMGDPVAVGAELDRLHRPRAQRGLLALTMAFALAGAVLRVWLTAGWADAGLDIDPGRTALALGLGCGALLGGYFLDLSFLGRHARALYVGALAAAFATWQLSPHTGVPVETYYVILCFPVVYACWLYACRGRGWRGLLLAAAGGIPLAAACFKTPWALGLLVLLVQPGRKAPAGGPADRLRDSGSAAAIRPGVKDFIRSDSDASELFPADAPVVQAGLRVYREHRRLPVSL